jgi:multicomponent Na+:H+ antiporter subunit E
MALIWLGLSGVNWSSWIVGGPFVLAATWISVKLSLTSPRRLSARGAVAFAGFFLLESLRGGWDVARRAFSPGPPLSPAIICYRLRLPTGTARLFFFNVISLLPGTAVVAIRDDQILVHVLEASPGMDRELRRLEHRVGALFRFTLAEETEAAS